MLLSLIALCAAPTPPQSAFTPPATQQALPATQPALSASLAAAEAQDGDQTIADAAVQAPAEPTPPPPASADGTVSNATLGAGVEDAPAQLSSAATSAAGPRALARRRESNAASDMWIGLVRTNGSVARRPATDAQRLRSAVERFHWVGRLPCAASLRVAFCLKGLRCSDRSADLARQIAPAELYSCVEEPAGRANGTEAVCAFRFLVDNYERRDWAGVYFAHDDLAVNGAHIASFDALETFLRRSEWPQWPESLYDLSARECGCAVVRERGFGQGYYWWKPMHWWIESFRGRDGEQLVADQRLHWPLSFMFAVDALTVRRHRRSYYVALHRLARQGIQLQHDIQVGPGSLGDGFNMVYHPDTFGHAMERLPFLLFANGSTGEHDALCEPHCSSNASSMLGPRALAIIRRKVQLLNQRAVFPPDVALPSPMENLVRVSKSRSYA